MRGMNGMESLGVDANQALSDVLKAVPSLSQGFVQSYQAVAGTNAAGSRSSFRCQSNPRLTGRRF